MRLLGELDRLQIRQSTVNRSPTTITQSDKHFWVVHSSDIEWQEAWVGFDVSKEFAYHPYVGVKCFLNFLFEFGPGMHGRYASVMLLEYSPFMRKIGQK